jgi:hypothetical protein
LIERACGEQVADDAGRLMPALDAGGHYLVVSGAHAVELERRHEIENVGALYPRSSPQAVIAGAIGDRQVSQP